jgi:hypothetical protein
MRLEKKRSNIIPEKLESSKNEKKLGAEKEILLAKARLELMRFEKKRSNIIPEKLEPSKNEKKLAKA